MRALIPIPAKTLPSECRSCHQRIYWAKHPSSGKNHPVSVQHVNASSPTSDTDGAGISHFADCKHAAQHRKAKA